MSQNAPEIGRRAHSVAETCALTGLGRDAIYTAIRRRPPRRSQTWAPHDRHR
jgi:hypothetical protein